MESNYKYYAFISYSGKDEKWAKWLHTNLEHYRIPATLYKENPNIPKKIRPVFWYKKDLSGTKLKEALEKELEASEYLIVICSPDSAKSDWVNEEINSFIKQGKGDKIIPFIVNGIHHSINSDEECFPPILRNLSRDEEVRGIDIRRKEGKYHALVDVIATMFGLRFDVLWQRHERERKKIRNLWIVVISLLLSGILCLYDYNRPMYEYYANYIDVYGKPVGVVKLTEDQLSKRNNSYQFEYRRIPFGEHNSYSWRVVKVSAVNSSLRPHEIENTEYSMRYPIQEYKYYEKTGNVSQIYFYNETGDLVVRHNLTSRGNKVAAIADIVSADEERGSGFLGADQLSILYGRMDLSKSKAKIVRFVYERDSCGYIVKQTFHSNNDDNLSLSSICDENGVYGIAYRLNENGFPVESNCLDANGNKIVSKKGFSTIRYQYDDWTNSIFTEYCDLGGNPVKNELEWAVCTNFSDKYGNVIEENYFSSKGERCMSNRGVSTIRYEYDTNGYVVKERFYGIDGLPILNYRGIASYGYKYDNNGNVVEALFYDKYDKVKRTVYGFASSRNRYDSNGNCIEVAYFDEKGKPCVSIEGCARWTRLYDENNNLIEHWFWGVDGKLCLLDGYTAGWTATYNENGQRMEKRNFNQNKELSLSDMGYAIARYTYDNYGNEVGCKYFDIHDKPCKSVEGFAEWAALYNANGQKIRETYFDENGIALKNKYGYASIEIAYNEMGDVLSITKYDEKNIVIK